jgi:hypothetical protein
MINDEIGISPSPRTRLHAAAQRLVSYWNDARLRAAQAKSGSVRHAPGAVSWRDALEDVLRIGYGLQAQSRFVAGAWERVRWRTTPSAGALYPYEVIASVVGEASYLWDIETGRLLPSCLPPLTRDDLAAADLVTTPGQHLDALLILVARPWLSMKKYNLRGYTYCHLDAGHVAANLGLYTQALGFPPTLHLRFSHATLADRLKLGALCREPLAVLSFASAGPASDPQSAYDPEARGLEPPEEKEILNWESLHGLIPLDSQLEPPLPPSGAALLQEPQEIPEEGILPLPAGRPQPSAAGEWRAAILGRRSAKGFRDAPLNVVQIGELLAALRTESLAADCPPEPAARLGVRLVARNVDGLGGGVYAYAPRSHALYRIDTQADDDPRPACMQQDIAGKAAALLILHAPIQQLLDEQGYSGFTELLFHVSEVGQRLHLAAARLGAVGMTCVGGFDGEESAALARLAGDEEVAYVILLGISDDAAFKHDRLRVAFSHGQTSTLED